MTTKKKTKKTKKFTVTVKDEATTAAPATTQASADATTQDAKANASVQSVSLSNNTPKVDDTITATVSFKTSGDAATFAWYTVDATSNASTLIDGATSSSIKVTEAMVGKYIKVQATGSDSSSAVATTTSVVAASDEAELAITAKQIGASKILVTANKAITKEDTVTVMRGSSEVGNSFVSSGDGLQIIVTTEIKIGAAEYTVKVTPKDTKKAAATTTFTGVASTLEKIDFVGDELVLTTPTFDACSVKIFGYDNFGEKVSLSTLQPYTSKGDVAYTPATNEITVSAVGGVLFQTGESITITAVYQDGTTVKQVAKALKVSEVSAIKDIKLGELQTSKAELKGQPVTLKNLATGSYYKTIVATDQYGNKLTAKNLAGRLNTIGNPTGTLFVTGSLQAGSYVWLEAFDELEDGTAIVKFNVGGIGMPGTQTFTYTAVGGYTTTDTVTVVDNPYIDELTVNVPELYGTKTSGIDISAKDQNGTAVNLYDFVGDSAEVNNDTFEFTDVNGTTKAHTTIRVPDSLTLIVDKDTLAKTVKFSLKAGDNPAAANKTAVLIVTTAGSKPSNVNCAIQQNPYPFGISEKLKDSGSKNIVVNHTETVDLFANITLLDQYGSSYGTVADSDDVVNGAGALATAFTNPAAREFAVIVTDSAKAVVADPTQIDVSDTYTVTLYQDKNGSADIDAGEAIATKTFTVKIGDANVSKFTDFTATLTSGDKLLFAGVKSQDKETIKVTAKDANGDLVTLKVGTDYALQLTSVPKNGDDAMFEAVGNDITLVNAKGIEHTNDATLREGKMVVNVYGMGALSSTKVASVEVPYSNKAGVTTKYIAKVNGGDTTYDLSKGIKLDAALGCFDYDTAAALPGTDMLKVYLNKKIATMGDANAKYYEISAVDQYGLSNFSCSFGAAPVADTMDLNASGTLTLSGSLNQDVNVIYTP